MAKRTTTSKNISTSSVGKDLDEALDFNSPRSCRRSRHRPPRWKTSKRRFPGSGRARPRGPRPPSQISPPAGAALLPHRKPGARAPRECACCGPRAGRSPPSACHAAAVFLRAGETTIVSKDARALAQGLNRRSRRDLLDHGRQFRSSGSPAASPSPTSSRRWPVPAELPRQLTTRPGIMPLIALTIMPVDPVLGLRRHDEARAGSAPCRPVMTEMAIRLAEPGKPCAEPPSCRSAQAVLREVAPWAKASSARWPAPSSSRPLVHTEVKPDRALLFRKRWRASAPSSTASAASARAVVTPAERVRASITGAHETLKDQLPTPPATSSAIPSSALRRKLSMTITIPARPYRSHQRERHLDLRQHRRAPRRITDRIHHLGRSFRQPPRHAHREP